MVAVRVGNKRKIDPVTGLDVFPGLGHPVRGAYEPHLLHNWGIRPPPGRREEQPAGVVVQPAGKADHLLTKPQCSGGAPSPVSDDEMYLHFARSKKDVFAVGA